MGDPQNFLGSIDVRNDSVGKMSISDSRSQSGRLEHHFSVATNVPKIEQKINVELPNGVKNVIKFYHRGDWTVKELLKHICKKLKLKPEDHYLVFDYKELKEREEVVKLGLKQDSVVKIFYRGSSIMKLGVRVSLSVNDVKISSLFKETDNLWYIANVLMAHDSFDEELVPLMIYKKEELIGEKIIRKVRLRDIGVTNGTCSLKFFQLRKEDLDNRHGEKLEEKVSQGTVLSSLDAFVMTGITDTGMKFVHFKADDEITPGDEYLDERRAIAFMTTQFSLEETDVEDYLLQEYFDYTRNEIVAYREALEIQLKSLEKHEICAALKNLLDKERSIRRPDSTETAIRIIFPDNAALQALFNVNETVDDIIQLIIKYTNYSENEFDVSLEPPPHGRRLAPGIKLWDINCVPAATVYCMPRDESLAFYDTFLPEIIVLANQTLANETALLLRGDSLDTFFSSYDTSRLRSMISRKHGEKKSSLRNINSIAFKNSRNAFSPSRFIRGSRSSRDSHTSSNRPTYISQSQDVSIGTDEDDDSDTCTVDYRTSRLRRQRKNSLSVLENIDREPGPNCPIRKSVTLNDPRVSQ